jgi:putative membrane protein
MLKNGKTDKIMKSSTTLNTFTALLFTIFITACQPTKKEEGSAEEAKQQNEANLDRDEEKDAELIVSSVSNNFAEIALAKLALKKYTKVLDELKAFASKKGIATPNVETHGAEIDNNELSELQGQRFDKKWCQTLADRHERSIRLFERRSDKTDDMELKSWIDATLYTSKEHLEMLKMYKEKIK